MHALYGKPYDMSTVGGATAWRLGSGLGPLVAGLMSIVLAVRHTRAEEEAGLSELTGSAAVGWLSSVAAAMAVTGLATGGLVAATTAGLAASGERPAGALGLGLAIGVTGWLFGALALVAAQLGSRARTASGTAGAALACAYALRILADLADSDLRWLSPFAWAQAVRPFAGNSWAWLVAPLAATAGIAAAAVALAARRDLGAGLLADRPGQAHASTRLRSVWTLRWRTEAGALLRWATAVMAFCAVAGMLTQEARSVLADSATLADAFRRAGGTGDVADAFVFAMLGVLALAASGLGIQLVLRLRGEEAAGRAEPVLATPVSRPAWALSHLAVAFAASAGLLLLAGAVLGLADGARTGEMSHRTAQLVSMAAGQVPAAWSLAALALALAGALPRLAAAAWIVLGACVVLGQVGTAFGLPEWAGDLSPFAHAPRDAFAGQGRPALLLTLLASAALIAVGTVGARRRDVPV